MLDLLYVLLITGPSVGTAITSDYSVQRIPGVTIQWSQGMAVSDDGRLFVGDKERNRILVLRGDEITDVIGRIGQSPGQLYRPAGLAYAGNRLYVAEQGNYRIQTLDLDGSPLSSFTVDFVPTYIAATPDGRIILNDPGRGGLVSVFDVEGKPLSQIGTLLQPKQAYPRDGGRKNATTLNRGFPLAHDDEYVYFAFQFVPLVQKWRTSGEKVWELRLQGSEVDTLVAGLLGKDGGKVFSTKSTAGEPQIWRSSCLRPVSRQEEMLSLRSPTRPSSSYQMTAKQ